MPKKKKKRKTASQVGVSGYLKPKSVTTRELKTGKKVQPSKKKKGTVMSRWKAKRKKFGAEARAYKKRKKKK